MSRSLAQDRQLANARKMKKPVELKEFCHLGHELTRVKYFSKKKNKFFNVGLCKKCRNEAAIKSRNKNRSLINSRRRMKAEVNRNPKAKIIYQYNCQNCESPFIGRKNRYKFCSTSCYHEFRFPPARHCPVCSKEIPLKNQTFCSKKCSGILKRTHSPLSKKGRKRLPPIRLCVVCKEKLSANKIGRARTTCSLKCKTILKNKVYYSPQYQIGLILREAAKIKTSILAA